MKSLYEKNTSTAPRRLGPRLLRFIGRTAAVQKTRKTVFFRIFKHRNSFIVAHRQKDGRVTKIQCRLGPGGDAVVPEENRNPTIRFARQRHGVRRVIDRVFFFKIIFIGLNCCR